MASIRRKRLGNVKLTLAAGERSGKLVAELTGVSKRFGERTIVQDLSLHIQRGDRLGLIGPNGAGKSTLLKLILGQMTPDVGEVRLGINLQVAYFDQMREQLDPERTLLDSISPGSDWVQIGAQRKHVMTYHRTYGFPYPAVGRVGGLMSRHKVRWNKKAITAERGIA